MCRILILADIRSMGPVVVFGVGKNLLFKSIVGRCAALLITDVKT